MSDIIKGEDLLQMGFPEGKAIGIALRIADKELKDLSREDISEMLSNVLSDPAYFLHHEIFGQLADELMEKKASSVISLKEVGGDYSIYGAEEIEEGAIRQMEVAMKLPVTVGGALMPDAHQGYGLPIGGVLATDNAIIPYGVGVDIGCRMALSIYDIPEKYFFDNDAKFKRELIAWTKFGAGAEWQGKQKADHAVLENQTFRSIPVVKELRNKAYAQLGTSGGGNHFAEFGLIEFAEDDPALHIRKGRYLALLTHSGSRGLGATIAGYYTRLAKELCKLPGEAANLAYLDLDSAEGQEYWLAMHLAGDYASACHEVIHDRLANAIGGQVITRVENHHNFAWKENWNGRDVIVHRKGATPASKDVMGIIPGSMTAPGFLVRGKGEQSAIYSASHGAGRRMGRKQAIKTFNRDELRKKLSDAGVTLIGAGLDEAPMAYKDIHRVMSHQEDLVDIVARFSPLMVRMADDGSRETVT